jgi:hypothetical protein
LGSTTRTATTTAANTTARRTPGISLRLSIMALAYTVGWVRGRGMRATFEPGS